MELLLIGIGTGNPEHLTLQAIRALRSADLVLVPRKGAGRDELADLRLALCTEILRDTPLAEFDMPERDPGIPGYLDRVEAWHDKIAALWREAIAARPAPPARAALLVWGDPALFDSTMRIAARLERDGTVARTEMIPGITAIAALTAAHRVPLNGLGAPVLLTTGRRLRDEGWPPEAPDRMLVMLDAGCAFEALEPAGISIWWGAYLGMAGEITESGPLAEAAPRIRQIRTEARAARGWIMDIYLLVRERGGKSVWERESVSGGARQRTSEDARAG